MDARPISDDEAAVWLRRAEPGDELAVAAVHVRSWQVAYRGLLPEDYLHDLRPEDRASRYTFGERGRGGPRTVLAIDGVRVVGFATTGPARDDDSPGWGELYALYVHPDGWGRGTGRALMLDARERLAGEGFSAVLLWVLVGNQRAQRFYRIDGWSPDGSRRREEEVHGVPIDETRYRRSLS